MKCSAFIAFLRSQKIFLGKYLGYHIWLNMCMGAFSSLITAHVFLPVFYKMKATCIHEYFNYR